VYYASLDPEPTKLLVDLLHEKGQRAIVGKVCRTGPHVPP
jgi:hypothetical protein